MGTPKVSLGLALGRVSPALPMKISQFTSAASAFQHGYEGFFINRQLRFFAVVESCYSLRINPKHGEKLKFGILLRVFYTFVSPSLI